MLIWDNTSAGARPEVLRQFLQEFPNGEHAAAARAKLAALEKAEEVAREEAERRRAELVARAEAKARDKADGKRLFLIVFIIVSLIYSCLNIFLFSNNGMFTLTKSISIIGMHPRVSGGVFGGFVPLTVCFLLYAAFWGPTPEKKKKKRDVVAPFLLYSESQ